MATLKLLLCALLLALLMTKLLKWRVWVYQPLNLSEKLSELTEVEGGKYHIVYFSAGSALDKRFLQFLKKGTVFSRQMVACVVDESDTIGTWTGLR